jgi:hypothetical protein
MEWHLSIGIKPTGISVVPDGKWPGVWRVRRGEHVSDMTNLTRAKDAALSWLSRERGRGVRLGEQINWHMGEKPSEAPPIDLNGSRVG